VHDLGGSNDRNNSQLKKEILELTDRLYHSWKEVRNTIFSIWEIFGVLE
jgi:hypothetical protein